MKRNKFNIPVYNKIHTNSTNNFIYYWYKYRSRLINNIIFGILLYKDAKK